MYIFLSHKILTKSLMIRFCYRVFTMNNYIFFLVTRLFPILNKNEMIVTLATFALQLYSSYSALSNGCVQQNATVLQPFYDRLLNGPRYIQRLNVFIQRSPACFQLRCLEGNSFIIVL